MEHTKHGKAQIEADIAFRKLRLLEFTWPFATTRNFGEESEESDPEDSFFESQVAYAKAHRKLHKTIREVKRLIRKSHGRKQTSLAAKDAKDARDKAERKIAEMEQLFDAAVACTPAAIKLAAQDSVLTASSLFAIRDAEAIEEANMAIGELRAWKARFAGAQVVPYIDLAADFLSRAQAAKEDLALSIARASKKISDRQLAVLQRLNASGQTPQLKISLTTPKEQKWIWADGVNVELKHARTAATVALQNLQNQADMLLDVDEAKVNPGTMKLEDVLPLTARLSFAMQDMYEEQDGIEAYIRFALNMLKPIHANPVHDLRIAEDCADSLNMKISALQFKRAKASKLLQELLSAMSVELDEPDSESDEIESDGEPQPAESVPDSEYDDGGVIDSSEDES